MINIENYVDLQPFNTFHVQANARYFTRVASLHEFLQLLHSDVFKQNKHLILGGGSNILLTTHFDGLVIKNEIKGIAVVAENEDTITLEVGSGENWHDLVIHCVKHDWGGIENLSLIPGTVGAAPMQNIGAYGAEIKDVLESVQVVEITSGLIVQLTKDQCQFGYRESIFKLGERGKYFISSITLTLTKQNHRLRTDYGAIREVLQKSGVDTPTIQSISDAVIAIRKSKLPNPEEIGNAGSFFKNPSVHADVVTAIQKEFPGVPTFRGENNLTKIPAGWLIEQCGWKGKTLVNIGVHKDQALVLVNYGGGKGDDIWNLALDIQKSVKDRFGIELQPEVNKID